MGKRGDAWRGTERYGYDYNSLQLIVHALEYLRLATLMLTTLMLMPLTLTLTTPTLVPPTSKLRLSTPTPTTDLS